MLSPSVCLLDSTLLQLVSPTRERIGDGRFMVGLPQSPGASTTVSVGLRLGAEASRAEGVLNGELSVDVLDSEPSQDTSQTNLGNVFTIADETTQ